MHDFHASVKRNTFLQGFAFESFLVALAALLAGYLAAWLGGALAMQVPQTVWPFWPGCAVLTAMLVLMPRRSWPAVLCGGLGGFVVYDLQVGVPFVPLALLILSDLAEVLVAAWGITHFLGARPRLNSLRNFAIYSLFGVFVAPLIAASLGSLALNGDYWINWRIAAVSEALAFLTIAPAILGWASNWRSAARRSASAFLEMAILLALVVPLCYLSFVVVGRSDQPILLYSLLPFLLWSALRFGPAGVGTVGSVIAFVSVWGAVHGGGPFADANTMDDILSLQVFLLFAATPFMALALLVEEHRDAQCALQESEERFHFAAQAGRMFAYEWDLRTDLITRTVECAEILGISGNVTQTTGAEVAKTIHPDDLAELSRIFAALTPANPIYCSALRVFRPDGKTIWLERTGRAFFDEQGQLARVIGMAMDITESKHAENALRESEERLRMAVRAGRMYAYEWDVASDTVVRSPECIHVLGPAAPVRTTRLELMSRVHPDDTALCAAPGVTPENPIARTRYRALRDDGDWVWVEKTARAFFDASGNLVRMVGMIADITERKQAEEALASVSRRLIEAHEEERTHIARELHDDINQRLALLAIELERLMQAPAASANEIARKLRAVWERVSELTNDIQAISHRYHSSKLEYLGIVPAASGFCRELAEQKKVKIEFRHSDIPENLAPEIALCLFRVLQEALHNAVKNSGVSRFGVELCGFPEELLLTVSDSGRGFDPEAAMKSHGLGLISMRERLHLVNGDLRIDSHPDRGTRIYARVPIASKKSMAATAAQ